MAARHLRRLRGDDPLLAAATSDDEDESPSPPAAAKPPFNPFDLLDDGDGAGVPSDDDEAEGEEQQQPRAPSPPPPPPTTKRKKKKKKGKPQLDEVDAALAELGLEGVAGGGGGEGVPAPLPPARASALAVDARALRGDDEARRLFGVASSSVIGAASEEAGGGAPPPPRGARRTPFLGGAALGRGASASGGLTLAPAGPAPGGGTLFRCVRGPAYEAGLNALAAAQATHDPRAVVSLLSTFPAHADVLLTVYDLLRLTGQHDAAGGVLERALGALEAAWTPAFAAAVGDGSARLDGADPSTRPLFTALARRAASLSRRGLHAAAGETAKLAAAMGAGASGGGDPVGARLAVDYFFLRARRPATVLALATDAGFADDGLPNWAFSVPLARARAEGGGGARGSAAPPSLPPSILTALQRAALTYPLAVVRLADRLADAGTPPPPTLASALARPPFSVARADADAGTASPSLARLCAIFAERHHPLWSSPDALAGLAAAAASAADAAANGSAAPWAAAADAAWPRGAPDAFAHLRTADFSDAVAALPEDEVAALNAAGALGGGGGVDAVADAALAAALARAAGGGGGGRGARAAAAAAAVRDMHPLLALLHTLMPWNEDGVGGGEWEAE